MFFDIFIDVFGMEPMAGLWPNFQQLFVPKPALLQHQQGWRKNSHLESCLSEDHADAQALLIFPPLA